MDWITRLNGGPGEIAIGAGSVEILDWSYSFNLADNQPHRHTFFEICLVGRHGRGVFTNLGVPYELSPGVLFIARPGALHQIVNTEKPAMELSWLSIQWAPDHERPTGDPREADFLLKRFADSQIVYVPASDSSQVASLWQALRSVGHGPSPASNSEIEHLAAALILAIARSVVAQEGAPSAIAPKEDSMRQAVARRAIRFINDNLDRSLCVPELAGYLCVSPRHLSRLFEEFTGTSPAAYIAHARLDRAASLLRSTDRPVKEIAQVVGFPDIHHFTRRFKRHWGRPPAEYRREKPGKGVPNRQNPGRLV
jgi:AraC family L-rhamnose operon transcriptional activator RhaR